MTAIRKHVFDFVAVIVLFVIGLGVGGYILVNQRFTLPKWVPLVGTDYYTLKGEFSTAQAVTPGQGQTVNIAGVNVGEISQVDLKNGRAVVTMKIKPKYAAIYRDAHMLLRPKTGLKDMIVSLDPGTSTAGKLPDGGMVPIQNTLPDINPDEILAALDSDTRDYLRILLSGGAEALRGKGGTTLSATFRRFEPTARDIAKITGKLAERRANLSRVVHNFQLLSTELAGKDSQISGLVSSSNAVFASFAHQDANLRETIRLLPGALGETRRALGKADHLARSLGPTLQALRPTARALGPTLRQTRPFLRISTPIIRDQLRPFARAALPTIRLLRPTIRDLAKLTPDLTTTGSVVNYLLNELAFNPAGNKEEGYLFWASWANHAGASVFATQDAHGPIRHGLFIASCSALGLLAQVAKGNQNLKLLIDLLNAPTAQQICPQQAGPGNRPPGTGGAVSPLPGIPGVTP